MRQDRGRCFNGLPLVCTYPRFTSCCGLSLHGVDLALGYISPVYVVAVDIYSHSVIFNLITILARASIISFISLPLLAEV
jgi:hypothetical protein